MNQILKIVANILQGLLSLLLLLSLALKIMGTPGEAAIFQSLEMEPSGRYVSMFAEIICLVGLVTVRFTIQAAILGILIYSIGVFFQLTELEINWFNDGGLRFYLNVLGLLSAIGLFWIRNHLAELLYRKGKFN
jgi:hypothetical protein